MNIMWIPLQPWISSPPFSGNRCRPISPTPRAMKLLATSRGCATTVPSRLVSRKTLSPYYTGPAGPRERRFSAMRAFEAFVARLFVLERVDDDDDGRAHQDDEQGREDAANHREEHFQRRLGGLLLRPLPAAAAHFFGLNAQHLRDSHAELLGLDQRQDEGVQFLDPRAPAHVIERLETRPAEPDFIEDLGELIRQRILELLCQPADGGIEAEPGLDRDGQQVKRIRQRQSKFFLAALDFVDQPDVRQVPSHQEAEPGRAHPQREAGAEDQAAQPEAEQGNDDAGDDFEDLEAVDAQRIWSAGKVDLVLEHDLAVLRHAGGEEAAQPFEGRLDEALAERQREFDLVEGQVVIAVLREPFGDQVLTRFGGNGLDRDEDTAEGQEGEDDRENVHSLHLDVCDFRDDAVADRDRDQAHPDQDVAKPFVKERRDVSGGGEGQ